jgi:CYTH domain-containing protein
MAVEKERKFLVKKLPEDIIKYPVLPIIQMYLALTEDTQLRLRIIDFKDAFICYKKTLSSTDKLEYEYRVAYNEAIATYNKREYDCMLTKDRIRYKGWDIDTYPKGLMVAEFEYSDDNPFPDKLPDWIGEEITGKREYSNIYIAKNFDKF